MFATLGRHASVRAYKGLDKGITLTPGTLVNVIGYIPDGEGGEALVRARTGHIGRCHALDLEREPVNEREGTVTTLDRDGILVRLERLDKMVGMLDRIMQYESEGFQTEEEAVEFFQDLIDTGLVWKLQGHYGRAAAAMIAAGYCHC